MSSKSTAVLALFVLLVLYALTNLGYAGPNPIGSTSNSTAPLIVPEPYAFAIWGPIYLGLIIFPIYQLVRHKPEPEHPLWPIIRYWYAANVVANGVWLVCASYDMQWTTVAIIVFMLFSLVRIRTLLSHLKADGGEVSFWFERLVFSMYFAWITIATVLNVATALHYYGWDGGPLDPETWTAIMMFVAAGVAAYVTMRFDDAPYAGVVVWAFAALAVRHFGLGERAATVWLGYIAVAIVVEFIVLGVRAARTPAVAPAGES